MSFRHFSTFGECKAWVEENIVEDALLFSKLIEGESHMEAHVVISLEPGKGTTRQRTYRTTEYTWRGFSEDDDVELAFAVLRGKAVKSLAKIVWRADSAQASWNLRLGIVAVAQLFKEADE